MKGFDSLDNISYNIFDYRENNFEKYIHFYNTNSQSNLSLVQIGFQIPRPIIDIGPAIRDHYLIHFVTSGKGIFSLQDKTYEVRENTCFLINPYEISYYKPVPNHKLGYYWIGIAGSHVKHILNLIGFSKNNQAIYLSENSIHLLINELLLTTLENRNDKLTLMLNSQSQLLNIFYLMATDSRQNKVSIVNSINENNSYLLGNGSYKNIYISTVILLIQNSYNEDFCIEKISNSMGLSRTYLSTLFKQQTGKSIKQHLLDYRIEKAKMHLALQEKNVSEVALKVGFKDPLYFSRIFKKKTGMSPSDYINISSPK